MAIIAEPLNGDNSANAESIRQTATRATGVAASSVVFVARGTLERTPSGKLRRRSLANGLQTGRLAVVSEHQFRK
jgi:acyl-CoA synthetase (AMP-forming)/AMP-acid ligase II